MESASRYLPALNSSLAWLLRRIALFTLLHRILLVRPLAPLLMVDEVNPEDYLPVIIDSFCLE